MLILSNNVMSVGILPEKGGLISSIIYRDKEILYYNEPNIFSNERPKCGIPILFPSCGRCSDDKITIEGTEYKMPIHGFAHMVKWEIDDSAKNNEIKLTLNDSDFTHIYYPFHFTSNLIYRLEHNKLVGMFSCQNLDVKEMPFVFGIHPYFMVANTNDIEIFIDGQNYLDYEIGKMKQYSNPIMFHNDSEITHIYEKHIYENQITPIVFRDNKKNINIFITSEEYFSKILLWKSKNPNFICIEPWGGMPNALNTPYHKKLACGEIFKTAFSFEIQDKI
ncbi:MAG: hypothetical protein LBT51_03990 [Fusobacteriaceae bacterium]|jgi:galactose mutarotase-like enzyme|nr:hypothetical protein [Fusobacteriaceae bacterium]